MAKCLAERSPAANGAGLSISPAEPGGGPTAGRRQTLLAGFAGIPAVPQGEAVLQNRLQGADPRTVGMSSLQVPPRDFSTAAAERKLERGDRPV